jgi:hypothetical protein
MHESLPFRWNRDNLLNRDERAVWPLMRVWLDVLGSGDVERTHGRTIMPSRLVSEADLRGTDTRPGLRVPLRLLRYRGRQLQATTQCSDTRGLPAELLETISPQRDHLRRAARHILHRNTASNA